MSVFFNRLFASTLYGLFLLASSAGATVVTATYDNATNVPVTAASYTATGNTVEFTLNFAPSPGSSLTVVQNTGLGLIQGTFANLAQGQQVNLTYAGISYAYVANYFGGTGNDLVLQWSDSKAFTFGRNVYGQLGTGTTTNSNVPVPAVSSGILAGKTLTAISEGGNHTLALCADGSLAAWGYNTDGQLGNGTTANSSVPVAVSMNGVLAGKRVIAISAGSNYSLVLCSDGTLAAWGSNTGGQLGNGTTTRSSVPVAVNASGSLAGKTVTQISAGGGHNLALCDDGTLVAWGANSSGQVGNNGYQNVTVPTAVYADGVLLRKIVRSIAAGGSHSLALCSDGTLAAWGANSDWQLGIGSPTPSTVISPTAVVTTGILAGKTVTAISAGYEHSLFLCSDGTLAACGYNGNGQLGNGTTTSSYSPTAVTTTGLLAGKTITAIAANYHHSHALCSDGSLASWGYNDFGQLGTGNTTSVKVPSAVTSPSLPSGSMITFLGTGSWADHTGILAAVAKSTDTRLSSLVLGSGTLSPAFSPSVTSYIASETRVTSSLVVTPTLGDLRASMSVNGVPLASGKSSAPIPISSGSTIVITVTAEDGVTTATYRITIRNDSTLSALDVGASALSPVFSRETLSYTGYFSPITDSIRITPVATDGTASILVNGSPVASGASSNPISLSPGLNAITVKVSALDGTTTSYSISAIRQIPLQFTYSSPSAIAVSADNYVATSNTALLSLGYAPATGTSLTVINNTGSSPVTGRFSNLSQGQWVSLTYNNATYKFIANYYGGDGNDLVLQWAHINAYAWGTNSFGQLGNGTTTDATVPGKVVDTGALAGKSVLSVVCGREYSMALCSDGALLAWGNNGNGQLGINSTASKNLPVSVDRTGVLSGKTITAIAAGESHSLALCSDGSIASWGSNAAGQLGNGTNSTYILNPVSVVASGALAGKTVMSISAGTSHSLALCSDGTLVAWGSNQNGQLGTGTTTSSGTPVAINSYGVLAGKAVVRMAAGGSFNLALCSDGTLASWGANDYGQLGIGTSTASNVPVAVNMAGVLAGKTVTSIAAGFSHCVVKCSDGSLAAWGINLSGAVGNGGGSSPYSPAAVTSSGVLAGRTVGPIAAGTSISLALCSDGLLATWGAGLGLGIGSTANSYVPVAALPPPSGEVYTGISYGQAARHVMAVAAFPLSGDSSLSALTSTSGSLSPSFVPSTIGYTSGVSSGTAEISVKPTTANAYATATVNEVPVASGAASLPMDLVTGDNPIAIKVTAETGVTTTYTVVVNRPPLNAVLDSPDSVPVTASGYAAKGNMVNIKLDFAPSVGTNLKLINNTGVAFIDGYFGNLAQGQHVTLSYGGINYDFVANYFGGTGNDLVLQWADTRLFAWGSNSYGQLGDTTTVQRLAPVPVVDSGVLSGKTITAAAGGYLHSLALCSDGTMAAWGYNVFGQLGNDSSAPSSIPMAVNQTGALSGKTVVAISAGPFHNLALCSDGTVVAWGHNNYGQLGTGDRVTARVPVRINPAGALAGKQVVAVAAGLYSSFALCSDGSVAAWGYNDEGELGDGTTTTSLIPVTVTATGVLAGKQVASISVGQYHTLALCSDGTLCAWGYNNRGQLGNNSTVSSKSPVAISSSGVLAGKAVSSIRAGAFHSIAACSDGTMAAWGSNSKGQLGTAGLAQSSIPIVVDLSSLPGINPAFRTGLGANHGMLATSDGNLYGWGDNSSGQLGNNSSISTTLPMLWDTSSFDPDMRLMSATSGCASQHAIAIIAGIRSVSTSSLLPDLLAMGGTTATSSDSDQDGVSDLLEFAFGLNPNLADAEGLPVAVWAGGRMEIRFTQPAGVTGVIYGAEWNSSLDGGPWFEIPDSGTGFEHVFRMPTNVGDRCFMRLKVVRP